MRFPRITLTALLTLATILTISDFPLIQNPKSKIQNSWVLAQTPDARKAEADRLLQRGLELYQSSQFEAALQSWQQALKIYQQIKDRQGEGKVLDNLGVAYRNLGDFAKAIEYHQQSLAIARQINDRQGEANALSNLGGMYIGLGEYAKVIDYQQQSLAIARQIKDRQREARALGRLGVAYDALGNHTRAIEYHQQRLAIAREIKDRFLEGRALDNLGVAYLHLGDYTKAIECYEQSLELARHLQDRQTEGKALGNLGVTYLHLGNYAKAIEYYRQSLVIARQIQDRQSERLALNNLGFALYKMGNLTAATETLIDGIKVGESLRTGLDDANKVSIFETQAHTYRHLQQVLIAQNKTDLALEVAEWGRARAFVELLARRLSSNPTDQLTTTRPTIEQIKQIAKIQNSTLVQYSIIYEDFKVQGKLQYKESELYVWVIQPTGEVTFRHSDLKPLWQKHNTTLADLVFTSRDSIGVRDLPIVDVVSRPGVQQRQEASLTQQLQQLHQLLIEPIADLLPTDSSDRVIFIPQEELFLAPFPAFKDKQGKYLIEKHTILTAPSIQVLELTRKQRERVGVRHGVPRQTNNALVVGNPTMPSVRPAFDQPPQQLPPLPGAEKEAQAIAPILKTKPLIGQDATQLAVEQLMPSSRIIHLATHGILDDVRGIGSAIALAPSGKDDGLLKAEQILEMKLNAELVVLSACNTGRGRITGDGVIGLSRSLISAGVPSVLVSLWSVPDAPTASLMTLFYQNLRNNPNKAQALRSAMLTTMKQHPNPKDWAAFTLIGEAQ